MARTLASDIVAHVDWLDLLGAIGKGIDVSALNHATADHDSVPDTPAGTPPWTPVMPESWPGNTDFVTLVGDSPWWMPDFLEKYIPTADTDKVDEAAQACRDTAVAVRDLVGDLHGRLQGLVGNNIDDLSVVGLIFVIGSILTDGGLDVLVAGVVEALDLFGMDVGGTLAVPIAEVVTAAETVLVATGGAIAITRGVVPAMQTAMSNTPNPEIEGVDAGKIGDEISGRTQPFRTPDPGPQRQTSWAPDDHPEERRPGRRPSARP